MDVTETNVVVGLVLGADRQVEVLEVGIEVGGRVGVAALVAVVVVAGDREERAVVDPTAVHAADRLLVGLDRATLGDVLVVSDSEDRARTSGLDQCSDRDRVVVQLARVADDREHGVAAELDVSRRYRCGTVGRGDRLVVAAAPNGEKGQRRQRDDESMRTGTVHVGPFRSCHVRALARGSVPGCHSPPGRRSTTGRPLRQRHRRLTVTRSDDLPTSNAWTNGWSSDPFVHALGGGGRQIRPGRRRRRPSGRRSCRRRTAGGPPRSGRRGSSRSARTGRRPPSTCG